MKPRAKTKETKRLLKSKDKHHSNGSGVAWVDSKELDPECAYFPPACIGKYLKYGPNETVLKTIRLGFDQSVTTDGSGVYAGVFSNSAAGAQNWSNYANTFEEYRVLAFRVSFDPIWVAGGSTASTFGVIASVVDRTDFTALTSYGLAERYQSCKKTPGNKRFHQMVTMASTEESDFMPTSTITATNWIKFYSSGNTASFNIGRINGVYIIQFRGLGIN